jgi:hypothetical protein
VDSRSRYLITTSVTCDVELTGAFVYSQIRLSGVYGTVFMCCVLVYFTLKCRQIDQSSATIVFIYIYIYIYIFRTYVNSYIDRYVSFI